IGFAIHRRASDVAVTMGRAGAAAQHREAPCAHSPHSLRLGSTAALLATPQAPAGGWPPPPREGRRRGDALAGYEGGPEPLRDRGQDQHGLHHGEAVADALAGAAAERQVSEAREPTGGVVCPALGTERLGLVEPACIPVYRPRPDDQEVAR